MVHHPIIQNLHYKTAKTFAGNTHGRRESSPLHQCYWFCSTDSSNHSSWNSNISRNAWRTWREHVYWVKYTFLQLLLCPELYFKSNLGLFFFSTLHLPAKNQWVFHVIAQAMAWAGRFRSRAELHWHLGGCKTPPTRPVYPWNISPSGMLTNEINTVLPVTAFQMLLFFLRSLWINSHWSI